VAPQAPRARSRELIVQLFVYGTLVPGEPGWHLLAPYVAERYETTVPGRLYDTGRGYPAAVFGPGTDTVAGWRCALHDPPLDDLDAFEGEEYERVTVTCADGVEAVAYHWIAPLTGCTGISTGTWQRYRASR
jgi:gamma-glutamylcyclotransferase (GGCT)/AIG2-like uncharacterized protein YtfP